MAEEEEEVVAVAVVEGEVDVVLEMLDLLPPLKVRACVPHGCALPMSRLASHCCPDSHVHTHCPYVIHFVGLCIFTP